DDIAPMDQILQRLRIESKLILGDRGNQLGAGFIVRFVIHILAGKFLEVFGVGWSQECALVMIEPPGHLRRIRVLEVNDDVLVAVEQAFFPRMLGFMGHAGEIKLGVGILAFAIKAVEQRGRGGTVETTIVKTESDIGHIGRACTPPSSANPEVEAKPFTMYGSTQNVKCKWPLAMR